MWVFLRDVVTVTDGVSGVGALERSGNLPTRERSLCFPLSRTTLIRMNLKTHRSGLRSTRRWRICPVKAVLFRMERSPEWIRLKMQVFASQCGRRKWRRSETKTKNRVGANTFSQHYTCCVFTEAKKGYPTLFTHVKN